jgi:energy-coupling factor transport system ATP-binding protein
VLVQDLVRELLDAGTAVVLLSQTADGLARAASHWIILDRGAATAGGPPEELEGSPELEQAGVVLPDRSGAGEGTVWAVRRSGSGTPGAPVLELHSLAYGYGHARKPSAVPREQVLRDLELAVHPGEIVAVTGANGAGKSTLLRHFNGLLRPASGEVRVCGRSIAGSPTGLVAASVGLLFQHPREQLFERTVLREVSFGLRGLFGTDAADRAQAALAAVGLSGFADAHPAELPSSAQWLLALATVLAREPAVLALDEPTVGLDRHGLELLRRAVEATAERGAAVVMVTHDLGYARSSAHRVLELSGGRLRKV